MSQLSVESDCPICLSPRALQLAHRFEEDSYYVVRCKACCVETILPHPTSRLLKEFYSDYHNTRTAEEQMPLLIGRSVELLEVLLSHLPLAPGRKPLRYMEVGFGNGASLLAAAQLGMEAVGFDLDPSNVREVTQRAQSRGLSVQLRCGDIAEAIEGTEPVDFVKASQLIEHLIDPASFVRSILKVMTPRGYLYLECPNNNAAFLRIKNRLRKRFARMNFYNSLKIGEHLWGFSQSGMNRLLRLSGYEVVFCSSYPLRHRYFQPENLFWYPSVRSGVAEAFSRRQAFPLLKSMIPVFDGLASFALSEGIGLATLARKQDEVESNG